MRGEGRERKKTRKSTCILIIYEHLCLLAAYKNGNKENKMNIIEIKLREREERGETNQESNIVSPRERKGT